MAYTYSGSNPSKLYLDSLKNLVTYGQTYSPRGKEIKELRPAIFEFLDPYQRVTFLRRINPFFQLAESWWILRGGADVASLEKYNSNISQFSDDGVYFNGPYGERMRTWNKNSAHNIIINPIDQLADAYLKLINDRDTRQAVISLYNPMFDSSIYTIGEQGKDICCLSGDTVIASPEGDIKLRDLVDLVNSDIPVKVYTYDPALRVTTIKPVTAGALTRRYASVIHITLENGVTLKLTPDHKVYYSKDLFIVEAQNLRVGDYLMGIDGQEYRITVINRLVDPEDIYDITVPDTHTFFANGILVHNCNLVMTFKIRSNALNLTVFNRSNDIHWGLFGANLCQFTTIQEAMLGFLRQHYEDLKLGTYTHITDSLHMYTKDYSGDISDTILYKQVPPIFNFEDEPRMSLTFEEFNKLMTCYTESIAPYLDSDEYLGSIDTSAILDSNMFNIILGVKDLYWRMVFISMLVYRLVKLNKLTPALWFLQTHIPNCTWKVSMVSFLRLFVQKGTSSDKQLYTRVVQDLVTSEPNCAHLLEAF